MTSMFPRIVLMCCFLFLRSVFLFGQTREEIIAEIQKQFKEINLVEKFEEFKLENENYLENVPDGGAELIGYYDGGQLWRMNEFTGLSYGVVKREFYFYEGELFFIFVSEDCFVYEVGSGWNYDKVERTFEGRYYYDKTELITFKIKGSPKMTSDLTTLDCEKKALAVFEEGKQLSALLNDKREEK